MYFNVFFEKKLYYCSYYSTLINRITSFPNGSHFGIYTFASSSREPVPLSYNPYLSGADIRCQLQQYNLCKSDY